MLRTAVLFGLVALVATSAMGKVYFHEKFDDGWESRWTQSTFKGSEAGAVEVVKHGDTEFYGEEFAAKPAGLKTTEDARFYQLSAAFEPFSNKDSDLVLQFTTKNTQTLDCGGLYLKFHPKEDFDAENYSGENKYNIMFGPDLCGSTNKIHVIFQYKGEEVHAKNPIRNTHINDGLTHQWTLFVGKDLSYDVLRDGESVASGQLDEDFEFLPPKTIPDPSVSKPDDWVDEKKIADPEDTKPEGWDDIPKFIPDEEAEKPEDWDDELDGEWEAPTVPNPEYKGEWKPKMIDNPDYKGPWEHPTIDNPDYFEDAELYAFDNFAHVGLEVWQVKSGTVFGDIIIASSLDDVDTGFAALSEAEKAAKEADAAAKAAAAAKETEEELADDEEWVDEDDDDKAEL